jgi:2-methylisocitrate lyase-like PEP mutase family enzyme
MNDRSPAKLTPAARLTASLKNDELVVAPGVHDPLTARIIESLGFPAAYLGGNALGLKLCVGQPFVTLTETSHATAAISRAVEVPLIVDAGAGFGDAAHTARAWRELEQAGAAAIHIDDQVYPKRAHYHRGIGRLADTHVVSGKLSAAVAARRNEDISLIARTDAWRVTKSLDETISRGRAFADVGVDALLVLDLGPEDASRVRQELPDLPLVWIGGIAEPVPDRAALKAAGFAILLYPFNTVAAVIETVTGTWKSYGDSGRPARPTVPAAETLQTALRLVGMEKYWEIEQRTDEAGD